MPPTLCFISRPSSLNALTERQRQYFLLAGGKEEEEGRAALLCKGAIIKAAFPHCKWPFEKMNSEGERAKGSMPIYLIKPDYKQQVHQHINYLGVIRKF